MDLMAEFPLRGITLDDGFIDLERSADQRAHFYIKAGNAIVDTSFGPKYPAAVVWSPNKNGQPQTFICFEPMTGITNAANLSQAGKYPNLQTLAPGARWSESFLGEGDRNLVSLRSFEWRNGIEQQPARNRCRVHYRGNVKRFRSNYYRTRPAHNRSPRERQLRQGCPNCSSRPTTFRHTSRPYPSSRPTMEASQGRCRSWPLELFYFATSPYWLCHTFD